jgi:hypothetical protein
MFRLRTQAQSEWRKRFHRPQFHAARHPYFYGRENSPHFHCSGPAMGHPAARFPLALRAHRADKSFMDASTLEAPSNTAETPHHVRLPHAFTRENAAENATKATESRERNRKATIANSPAKYVQARLKRVRAQLKKIDALIDKEIDAQKLDRLVCAQNRLSEQWRIFSGIPLPGSRRPGREKPARAGAASSPLVDD